MRAVQLAVVFDQNALAGGGYQQAINAALLVKSVSPDVARPLYFTTRKDSIPVLRRHGISATLLQLSFFQRVALRVRYIFHPRLLKAWQRLFPLNALEKQLSRKEVDLVYFLSPTSLPKHLERLNYITTVWDLCHRDDPEFPEVRWNREFEARERHYRDVLPKAVGVLVDSDRGKENVIRRYCIDAERVSVMPFQPAPSVNVYRDSEKPDRIDVRKKYRLDFPYVFYPAQFWPHKNHVYLLAGLRQLEKSYGHFVGAVFSGGDKGNMAFVKRRAEELEVNNRTRFVGFISDKEIPAFYKQSLALVMPTYFGPTNLPPLEAFALGVPVLYSDKPGLREQVGSAAILLDLRDPGFMAERLRELIENHKLRDDLVDEGRRWFNASKQWRRTEVLEEILVDFRARRECWE